jgi:threonyl-tRNA synthetase
MTQPATSPARAVCITLPDGSQRSFDAPVSVADVAASIGSGLARAALGGRVDGRLVDTSHVIDGDAELAIVTARDKDGLDMLRHSCAHLMAYAVKTLFPEAQVTIGPVIENGFYYDFSYTRPFTPEDLAAIEKKMHELAALNEPVERRTLPRDEAIEYFKGLGEHYKAEIIASIPEGEHISLYREGGFEDLCRGPHIPSTGHLKHFKLMKVAGAYWRGDHRNEMLQRIYGTAWATKEELASYLNMLAEAERRDHRRLGRELDLFHIDEHSPGTIFWHPKGWTLWQELEQYMRRVYRENGYQEVRAPQILDKALWEKTGHWDKYRDNMFTTESEKRDYALKPMNCPGALEIFNSRLRSYKDLPLRLAEFGHCARNEPSGTLHGIMRVRGFVQDDAHILCTEEQIESEVAKFCRLLKDVYKDFGFDKNLTVKLSTMPDDHVGDEKTWQHAEAALAAACKASGMDYEIQPGEGAFYGPKLEFTLVDALGRPWQCGTIQLDYQLPSAERLNAEYIGADNQKHHPVMLHRAVLGSLERFLGILIEQYAGAFPVWLAPEQVRVIPIADAQLPQARELVAKLVDLGVRVDIDEKADKLGAKIRRAQAEKVPFMLVLGKKEAESGMVAVRTRDEGDKGAMPFDAFLSLFREAEAKRG